MVSLTSGILPTWINLLHFAALLESWSIILPIPLRHIPHRRQSGQNENAHSIAAQAFLYETIIQVRLLGHTMSSKKNILDPNNDRLLAIVYLYDKQCDHFMAARNIGRNLANLYSQFEYLSYLDRNILMMEIIFLECHAV